MADRGSRRRWSRNPLVTDAALAAVFVVIGIAVTITVDAVPGERDAGLLGWCLMIAANAAVAWRRSAPLVVLWSTFAATVAFWVLDYAADDAVGMSLIVAVYSVAAHVGRPRSLYHGLAVVSLTIAVMVAGVLVPDESLEWVAVPVNLIVLVTAWVLGDNLRTRRDYLRELEASAARSEAHRLAESRAAAARERTRIARELHDVVAHSMSVMVVQAGAARRVVQSDPRRALDAIAAIEATGRASLEEMRGILGVLRNAEESAELTPTPGLDDLDELARTCAEAGLEVEVGRQGHIRPLAGGLELTIYRVVQESLTNSLKHAGRARARVCVDYRAEEVVVNVVDDGRGAAAGLDGSKSGHGLVGMRERVEAFGGSLTTGPRQGGGFEVEARLPATAATGPDSGGAYDV